MTRHILISLILFVFFTSCKQNIINKPKIEIYLPKERIESKDGIKLTREMFEVPKDSTISEYFDYRLKYQRLDTVNNREINAGSFEANESNLKDLPLIEDNEIIGKRI